MNPDQKPDTTSITSMFSSSRHSGTQENAVSCSEVVGENAAHCSELVADAGSALNSAVCSIAKCEALLISLHEFETTDKYFESMLCKLKTIKDSIGMYLFSYCKIA